MSTKTLFIITGPTAIGKTKAAIETALHFKTEIISADSRQIYKELNIGTAVPTLKERRTVKHHFIQSHSIFDNYNASRYENEALTLLNKLFQKYDSVVLTGGSMLYIDALCKGIDKMPDIDKKLRRELNNKYLNEGIEGLRLQLKHLDPTYYHQVDLKNHTRIIHALEICLLTGKPYSSFRSSSAKNRPFNIIKTGLNCNREELHQRINIRVDKMINDGLEREAKQLFQYHHLNSLNTVGYREFFSYFKNEISKEKAIDLIKRNTRRYARKQISWFKRDTEMKWFSPYETDKLIIFFENNKIQ